MKIDKDGYEVELRDGKYYNWLGHLAEDVTDVDLTGRYAKCSYCGRIHKSDDNLAFFRHHKGLEHDEYYCGCRGWD